MGALTLGVPITRERASSAVLPTAAEALRVEDGSAARRGRARRRLGWGLGLAIAGSAATLPVWAESEAQARLHDQFGDEFAIAIDLAGVELRGLSREFAEGRGTITIERLHIRPGDAGLIVEIDGLAGRLARQAPRRAQAPRVGSPAPSSDSPKPSKRSTRDRLAAQIERLVAHLHGVPVEVRTQGRIDVELAGGLSLVARDPGLQIDAAGHLASTGRFVAGTEEREWLAGSLDLASEAGDPFELALAGSIVLDPRGVARELVLIGSAGPSRVHVEVDEPTGGHASIDAWRGGAEAGDQLELLAKDLPLALLDPILELLEGRAIDQRPGPAIAEARLTGRVAVERRKLDGSEQLHARFDHVDLAQLVIERDWLAARPVHFAPLEIDGELTLERSKLGQRTGSGQLMLGHAGVQVQVRGQLDAAHLDIGLDLPKTECQALLDAMPEGTALVLAGSELSGALAGRFGLDLDFAALAEARATYLGEGVADHEFDLAVERGSFVAPGQLVFEFPFLDQCKVDRLGPAVDVAGLAGPYHHDFPGKGPRDRRVLAAGDANYVAIREIPQLELAFVILEDWRFWMHDGFDREQIHKAFWYDLMAGRTSRGASTISQQTARSLWLRLDHGQGRAPGFDRSIARKLVEALLTSELERQIDKRRILEVYLNIIELGPEIRGVTEAARYHFDKRPQDLDLIEALHLASLAPAPVGYSRRFASGSIDEDWREHLRLQVRRLRIRGMISESVAAEAMAVRLDLVPHPERVQPDPER